MRIWSIHPKYLDSKGLVALWREALLAKKVLEGKTKGYKSHPQLLRFKERNNPVSYINQYLKEVFKEAVGRNYNFDSNKIDWRLKSGKINVNRGQIRYEFEHLLHKLKVRDKIKYAELLKINEYEVHPLFKIVQGDIENWEIPLSFPHL